MLPLLSGALLFGALSDGMAADMPLPPAPMPSNPPPIFYTPAAYSWTGIYVGGNFGWDWSQISDTITTAGGGTGSLTGNVHGFLGGGQAGFNWQFGQQFVVGIEADFQGTQATAGSRSVNGVAGPAHIIGLANMPYFGTARGRVGYSYGTLLLYATAGAVYGENTLRGTVSTVGSFFSSADFLSWTAGAGIEAGLGGQFSGKLEYLFIGSPSSLPLVPGATALTGTWGTSLIRAGVNYRF
jgi:outer membrane immunogenic protein